LGIKESLASVKWAHIKILRRISNGSYELDLSNYLASIEMIFHVSLLKKCVGDPTSIILLKVLGVKEDISYEV